MATSAKVFPVQSSVIMKWTAIAATAAGLVLTLGLVFAPGSQSTLFAQMQDALAKVKTIQCSNSLYHPGEATPWKTSVTFIEEPDRARDEVTANGLGTTINIFDLSTGKYAVYAPANKKAMVGNVANVEQLRSLLDLFVGILRNADAAAAVQIDRYKSGGVWFVEFEYTSNITEGDPVLVNVIVDEKTTLPVEIKFFDSNNNLEREITDIVFDETIADEMFSTDAPQGYNVTTVDR